MPEHSFIRCEGNFKTFYLASISRAGAGADFHLGVDFEQILQGLDAEISLQVADPISRALQLGLTLGLQLGLDQNAQGWPLRSSFNRSN